MRDMDNLLAETRQAMEQAGRTPEQIVFIGSRRSGHSCSWAEFEALADVEYDSGFGGAEVAGDLEIIFEDGAAMERGEYDGSEWWEYREPFKMPDVTHPMRRVLRTEYGYEDTLAEIHKSLDEHEPSAAP